MLQLKDTTEKPAVLKIMENESSNKTLRILKLMCEQTVPLFKSPWLKYTAMVATLQFGVFST